jgi:phosphoenolpyruvate-protein kinase (PTS system EI component)
VADLANALQPAVLRAIKQTVDVGHAHGIWVGMCGELAGNPLATPVLVGLGLDELSMSAPAIPQVKQVIRQLDTRKAREIADTVLKLDSADRITYYLNNQVARDHLPQ